MENIIQKSRHQIKQAKNEVATYIQRLQEKVLEVGNKIEKQIKDYEEVIEKNIELYQNLPDEDFVTKGHFKGLLQNQLESNPKLITCLIESEDPQLQVSPLESSEKEKLIEVHQIIRKALNLFAEQYEKAMKQMKGNLVLFSEINNEFKEDILFSQDRASASIGINESLLVNKEKKQSQIQIVQSQNEIQQCTDNNHFELQKVDILQDSQQDQQKQETQLQQQKYLQQAEESQLFVRQLDVKVEYNEEIQLFSLTNQPEKNCQVLCFSVLQDNRRAVMCTIENIFLFDLINQKLIRRGTIPASPTCIQPLYSYHYFDQENKDIDSQLFKKYNSEIIKINQPSHKEHNIVLNNSAQQKRQRKQQLVAVGIGSVNQIIDICVYSIQTLECIIRMPGHLRMVCKILQAPLDYDSLLTFSFDRKIICWSITKGQIVQQENSQHSQNIIDANLINEKELATFSLNGEVYLWDILYDQAGAFQSLKYKIGVYRQSQTFLIGQCLKRSENHFFSITSSGLQHLTFYLELNDYSSKTFLKEQLPHRVAGINSFRVENFSYVIILYSEVNYCDVFRVPLILKHHKSNNYQIKLIERIVFPPKEIYLINVLENPRVQFASTSDPHKLVLYLALNSALLQYTISIE